MAVLTRLIDLDVDMLDLGATQQALRDAHLVVVAMELTLTRLHARLQRLAEADTSIDPTAVNAAATKRSSAAVGRDGRRAKTLAGSEPLADAVANGSGSMEHVDALAAVAGRLPAEQRRDLLADPLVGVFAAGTTPGEYRAEVERLARIRQTDDGVDRFEQQRRACSLSSRIDRDSGMHRFDVRLDPERGALLAGRIEAAVKALFNDTTPADCPDDPAARQEWLRAMALMDLTDEHAGSPGVVDMTIVVDIETLRAGCNEQSLIEFGPDGAIVPVATLRRYLCTAHVSHVLLHDGVSLALGRTTRLASRDQRRMARAMYPTSAITGCETAFERCELHHIDWWRHGGHTDLTNLVPLCSRHHHKVHEGGWKLHLHPETRVLNVAYPNGTVTAMPPPRRHTTTRARARARAS